MPDLNRLGGDHPDLLEGSRSKTSDAFNETNFAVAVDRVKEPKAQIIDLQSAVTEALTRALEKQQATTAPSTPTNKVKFFAATPGPSTTSLSDMDFDQADQLMVRRRSDGTEDKMDSIDLSQK